MTTSMQLRSGKPISVDDTDRVRRYKEGQDYEDYDEDEDLRRKGEWFVETRQISHDMTLAQLCVAAMWQALALDAARRDAARAPGQSACLK